MMWRTEKELFAESLRKAYAVEDRNDEKLERLLRALRDQERAVCSRTAG